MISISFAAAINHLLAQEPWARDKLQRHAGKVAQFDAGVAAVQVEVTSDGMLAAALDKTAHVTIRTRLANLPLILQNRERAFSYVQIEGDADFANTISQLSQSLRWEAEADLSRFVGDIAAVRMVDGAKAFLRQARQVQQSLAENTAEYFLEENPMLVRPEAMSAFSSDVVRLRDDVERLSKRIERLLNSQSGEGR